MDAPIRQLPHPTGPQLRHAGPADQACAAWQAASAALPTWAVPLLVALLLLGLLTAFQQVVRGAVQQGEWRRQAEAALTSATWRCQALRGANHASDCLARLTAVPNRMPQQLRRPAVLPAPVAPSDGAAAGASSQ